MSSKFELVKKYFDLKVWNVERVKMAVEKNWITREEFQNITGEAYRE